MEYTSLHEVDMEEAPSPELVVSISKKLSYVLRHGLSRLESCNVPIYKGGWVDLTDVLKVGKIFSTINRSDVEYCLNTSTSFHSGKARFKVFEVGDTMYVRATYGHSYPIESIRHTLPITELERQQISYRIDPLLELCMRVIVDNITSYAGIGDALDDALLRSLLQRMKEKKKTSRRQFQVILGEGVQSLDLEGCFVSDGIFRMIIKQCPALTRINLRGCFACATDQNIALLTKKLNIKVLNISECKYITDKGLNSITKNLSKTIENLDLSGIVNITDNGIDSLNKCTNLSLLTVSDCPYITKEKLLELKKINPKLDIESDLFSDKPIYFRWPTDIPYGSFSNHFPLEIEVDSLKYPTVQHYFQSQKYAGTEYAEEIRLADTPELAFKLGRKRTGFRTDWDDVKYEVMKKAIRAKFTQHTEARKILLSTGRRNIIQHHTNKIWADGMSGRGKNLQGKIIEEIREELLNLSLKKV